MPLSLRDLEQIFEPLSSIGRETITFKVNDTLDVTMRILTASEEIEVQRYARAVTTDGGAEDATTVIEYLDRFREATLAHAIVAIGEHEFGSEAYILTGAKTDSGVDVKIPRYEAILKIVKRWGRNLSTAVFSKFEEMSDKSRNLVEKAIKIDPADANAKIASLEEEIAALKDRAVRDKIALLDPRAQVKDTGDSEPVKDDTVIAPPTVDVPEPVVPRQIDPNPFGGLTVPPPPPPAHSEPVVRAGPSHMAGMDPSIPVYRGDDLSPVDPAGGNPNWSRRG